MQATPFRTGTKGRSAAIAAALALALAASLATSARADGFIYVEHRIIGPGPRPIPRPNYPLRVTRHDVRIAIDGGNARTAVEETFHNPNGQAVEGIYLFPMPPGASVASFAMTMNGKLVEGEVLEKGKAREIYESIVRRTLDPGLLEYVDRGLFRASVFPIPAGGSLDVRIAYEESLRGDHGQFRYRYPLDTGKYSAGDYQNVRIEAVVRAASPLRNIGCPSHDVRIERAGDKEARLVLEAPTLAADRDLLIDWNLGADLLAPLLLTHRDSDPEGYFQLSFEPRLDADERPSPPKDIVLILDTSGSMLADSGDARGGRRSTRLDDARQALRYILHHLRPQDRFNIVDFSIEARRFRDVVVEATEDNRAAALAYVDALKARGGTNIEEGLRAGLNSFAGAGGAGSDAERLRIACLVSDGEPTLGLTRPEELLEVARRIDKGDSRLFCFGVGVDVHTILLEKLAAEHRGAVEYVLPGEHLEVKLANFHDKIDYPVLTDLALEIRGAETSDVYPKPLPDIFHGEQLVVLGRFRKSGKHTCLLRGRAFGKEQSFEYVLDFSTPAGGGNEFLPRLWAASKIGHLLEGVRLNGESRELVDEIVRISKRHGILTPYTSYLIIEDERARPPLATRPQPHRDAFRRLRGGEGAADAGAAGGADAPAAAAREELRRAGDELRGVSGADAITASAGLRRLKEGDLGDVNRFVGGNINRNETLLAEADGRTFYRLAGRWTESSIDEGAIGGARRIEYLSEAYFALVREHPGVGRILSLGARLAFRWGGEVLLIESEAAPR